MRTIHAIVTMAILTLLSACQTTSYELRPPHNERGRVCVGYCDDDRESCRRHENRRAEHKRDDCERDAERWYHRCMREADSPETRRNCKNKKPSCYQSASVAHCDDQHRSCFARCGGTVTRVVEEW